MEQKIGHQNIKAMLLFACAFGNVMDKMTSDGQPMLGKIGHLMMLVPEVSVLPGVKFNEVAKEFGDLDEAEKADIQQAIKAKLDLADDKLEAAIEGGLGILLKLDALVKEGMALAKALKA